MSPIGTWIGLKGYRVIRSQSKPALRAVVEPKEDPCGCPRCGGSRLHSKGRYRRRVKHLRSFGSPVELVVDCRRFQCLECRRSFVQPLPGIRAGYRRGSRHTAWRSRPVHHRHHDHYHRRYDRWEDYWKWRAVGGALRLGAWYVTRPRYYTVVYYDDSLYYYWDGVYYRRIGSRYVVVAAPAGVVVQAPPPTYETVAVQKPSSTSNTYVTNNYYYANGTFYKETAEPASVPTAAQRAAEERAEAEAAKAVSAEDRQGALDYVYDEKAYEGTKEGDLGDEYPEENFKVVTPPMGATVSVLPEDAVEKKIDDATWFAHADTWYKPFYSGEEVVYMVSAKPEGAPG